MDKVFEDKFAILQTNMVSIALEYVEEKANYIYIYASYENLSYETNVFYVVENMIVKKHKLNELNTNFQYDVSSVRQRSLLHHLVDELKGIYQICTQYGREMPTEIKLIYDVQKNSLSANYDYDLKYTNTDDLTAMDIFNQWFEEIAKANEQKV